MTRVIAALCVLAGLSTLGLTVVSAHTDALPEAIGKTGPGAPVAKPAPTPTPTEPPYVPPVDRFAEVVESGVAVIADGHRFDIPPERLRALTGPGQADDSGAMVTAFTGDLYGYLAGEVMPALNRAAGTAVLDTYVEEDRTTGEPGHVFTVDELAEDLEVAMRHGEREVVVPTASAQTGVVPDTAPPTTADEAEDRLRALLSGVPAWSVAVVDLTDGSRSFAIDGSREFTAASTFKLFVAYDMLRALDAGEVAWSGAMPNLGGSSVGACFETMIVDSDNACPRAWLYGQTYAAATEQAHALGAERTHFTWLDMRTTADDLAGLLTRLYRGTLLPPEGTDRLLRAMEEQVWRWGIPAGVAEVGDGSVVADKIGLLGSLIHDAGIVYGPTRDYAVVIMTRGASKPLLAQAARIVHLYETFVP